MLEFIILLQEHWKKSLQNSMKPIMILTLQRLSLAINAENSLLAMLLVLSESIVAKQGTFFNMLILGNKINVKIKQ